MENLTLTSQELKRITIVFAVAFALILGGIALVQFWRYGEITPGSLLDWASASLTSTTLLFGGFCKWAWCYGPVPRWLGRPVIRGVWLGYLSSDYGRAEGERPLKKPIVFVVRQTYLTLSIQSFTDKQVGESKVEALLRNVRTDAIRLAYVFELKKEYEGSHNLVNGAGDLHLVSDGSVMDGAYWTSSPTSGRLRLRRVSKEPKGIDRFDDACRKWPDGAKWDAA